jgi:hypothetical protein
MYDFCDGAVEALLIAFLSASVDMETMENCRKFAKDAGYDFAKDHN